jgi:hypothetical protein
VCVDPSCRAAAFGACVPAARAETDPGGCCAGGWQCLPSAALPSPSAPPSALSALSALSSAVSAGSPPTPPGGPRTIGHTCQLELCAAKLGQTCQLGSAGDVGPSACCGFGRMCVAGPDGANVCADAVCSGPAGGQCKQGADPLLAPLRCCASPRPQTLRCWQARSVCCFSVA